MLKDKLRRFTAKLHQWRWKLIALLPILIFLAYPLPDPLFQVSYSTVLEARDGTLLGARIARDEQWRFPVADSIPEKFRHCLRMYEDEFFYQHPGVNPVALGKALVQNVRSGKVVRGGSTLSMQVVRMALGATQRTYFQKGKELLLALKLEMGYRKDEIFSLYAAHAPFGSNVVGLSAAAWRYYRKPPAQLSWAECATLAVLPNHPAMIYPGKRAEKLRQKRDFLLHKLLDNQLLDSLTYRLALLETLPEAPQDLPQRAPRLLSRSIQDGYEGQVVRTTLDARLQGLVNRKVARHHQAMRANHVHNAAALVLDVRSGAALAYVGNTNLTGDHGQYVDMITARRSTGSLLKPVLYAAALDEGILLPRQLLPDVPVFYQGFAPKNFDKKFYGAVPADVALIRSLNVPFVHLLREYGYEKFHQKLRQMGLASLDKPAGHYGLSLILGGAESSLWEVTGLYAGLMRTLQRNGRSPHQTAETLRLYHPNHYVVPDAPVKAAAANRPLIDPAAVWHTLQTLQQMSRPEEQAGWQRFPSASQIAWKTGTSHGFKDAWAVGLNDRYVVGVWLGNADGEGRPDLIGVKAAAPLLFDIFDDLEGTMDFPEPVIATTEVTICRKSGFPAGEFCETVETIYVSPRNKVSACPYHRQLQVGKDERYQVNSSCYPVREMITQTWFVLPPVEAYYYRQHHLDYASPPPLAPDCQQAVAQEQMEIIYPRHQTRLFIPRALDGTPGVAIFEIAHQDESATLYWHLDDTFLGKTTGEHQWGLHPSLGEHTLHVVDQQGKSLTHRFEVISDHG